MKETCPRCGGTGKDSQYEHLPMQQITSGMPVCQWCQGTGQKEKRDE